MRPTPHDRRPRNLHAHAVRPAGWAGGGGGVEMIDLTGARFGHLVVVRRDSSPARARVYWECLCDCGATVSTSGENLRSGCSTSCGCSRTEKRYGTPIERFHASYDIVQGGCWLWRHPTVHGYGKLSIDRREILAHRFSYEIHIGPIPEGLLVCHRCDVRACVNPEHLFAGTYADNNHDAYLKGRARNRGELHGMYGRSNISIQGEAHHCAKLCAADVRAIRDLLQQGHKQQQIADRFGVAKSAIWSVATGRTWRHVE